MKMEADIGDVLPETKEYLGYQKLEEAKKNFFPTDFRGKKTYQYLDF